jgi:UDP-N-acetyl-D-mannosaminouronate:lipid I N-acetyl-D-mannosaminouronosyltransferase
MMGWQSPMPTDDVKREMQSTLIRGVRAYAFPSRRQLLALAANETGLLIALNAEKLARMSPELRAIVNQHVGYADGYGAVLAMRRKGLRTVRYPGSELWLDLLQRTAGSRRVYLLGSTQPVIDRTVTRLRETIPGINITGARHGFFSADDDFDAFAAELASQQPDIVLVAMGSPLQERVMARLYQSVPARYVGLGGSFDVYVGDRRRAPSYLQRIGLEWLYRFYENPQRLPRLPAYLRFAALLALNRL